MKIFPLTITFRTGILFLLLVCWICPDIWGQEGLSIAPLFEKYGNCQNVTRVELNGSILKSHNMSMYKSLVFKDVRPYLKDILQKLKYDKEHSGQIYKSQEVVENGVLLSAYYQLQTIKSKKRYILFKTGKETPAATLIYIEGKLTEEELTDMLYRKK